MNVHSDHLEPDSVCMPIKTRSLGIDQYAAVVRRKSQGEGYDIDKARQGKARNFVDRKMTADDITTMSLSTPPEVYSLYAYIFQIYTFTFLPLHSLKDSQKLSSRKMSKKDL